MNMQRYTSFLEHNLGRKKLHTMPHIYSIEPSGYCNLRCVHCPQSLNDESIKRGIMDIETFKKVFEKIKPYAKTIILDISGEPLLNPDIFKIIAYIKKHKPQVYLRFDTNATLMDEGKADQLVRSEIDEISFSFDGEDKKTYEFIRRNATFEKTMANINYFMKQREEYNPKIKVLLQVVKLYEPGKDLKVKEDFKKMFYNHKDIGFVSYWAHTWSADFKNNREVKYEEAPHSGNYFPCDLIWKQMAISWDGRVYACCFDLQRTYLIGSILHQSVEQVWNAKKYQDLRESLVKKQLNDLCKNCPCIWDHKDKNVVRSGVKKILRAVGRHKK